MSGESSGENPVPAALAEVEKTFTSRREPELTILMPCLNEAETIGGCIDKAMGFLARSGIAGEVVIADNGSTDGSREISRSKGDRLLPIAIRGYGAGLIGGGA